jgi:hypothetical protein
MTNWLSIVGIVGTHLTRSTLVLRKADAVAFVPHETNGTSNVYQKTPICVTDVLRSSSKGTRKQICLIFFKGQESTFVACQF